jgi:uncharacterized membrane protein
MKPKQNTLLNILYLILFISFIWAIIQNRFENIWIAISFLWFVSYWVQFNVLNHLKEVLKEK